jgi:hypothetical protein
MGEQIASGNIVETDNGKYRLTTRGENFIFISKKIAKYFSVDEKFLDPQQ